MTEKEEHYEEIKDLLKAFREAESEEDYDYFLDVYGDYDELFELLLCFIEKYVLNEE